MIRSIFPIWRYREESPVLPSLETLGRLFYSQNKLPQKNGYNSRLFLIFATHKEKYKITKCIDPLHNQINMYPFKVLNLLVLKGISKIILILLVPLFIVAVIFFWKGISNNVCFDINSTRASEFGSFFGGYVGVMFSIVSTLLLIYTVIDQHIERQKEWTTDKFYKMLEFHNNIVNQLSVYHIDTRKTERSNGRRAFVIFKIQITRLLKLIEDLNEKEKWSLDKEQKLHIVYMVFYYGIDKEWVDFLQGKIKEDITADLLRTILDKILSQIEEDKDLRLGRTNQTSLSAYFRNMYNLIKFVDNDKYLDKDEKKDLITIYRAQLSSPELYVLFFNLRSYFGKKWNNNKYVERYELLKNIPKDYCDGYNPEDYYKIEYDYNE